MLGHSIYHDLLLCAAIKYEYSTSPAEYIAKTNIEQCKILVNSLTHYIPQPNQQKSVKT